MTIRPWMTCVAMGIIAILSLGYLSATTYLFFRDDLIGGALARQARLQNEYEDRIAALRQQLDRVTSRQLVDQQMLEQKVQKLLRQQDALFSRHGKLDALYERAEESGLRPMPAAAPEVVEKQALLGETGSSAIDALLRPSQASDPAPVLAYVPTKPNASDPFSLFSEVSSSLKDIEREQIQTLSALAVDAAEKTDAISGIMKRTGINVDAILKTEEGLGGPFLEPEMPASSFEESLTSLSTALGRLETVRDTANALPYGNPAPGKSMTSRYGNRIDPFLGRLALHAGIDFQAQSGEKVLSAGAGTVTVAEYSGGYGNLVEIDHGHGIRTRYGHLSRLLVNVGDQVAKGDVVGRAGSTGRSTGPHVHYEVRRDGAAVDPLHFLNAGMKLNTYLN